MLIYITVLLQVAYQPVVARRLRARSCRGRRKEETEALSQPLPQPCAAVACWRDAQEGGSVAMASKIECPRCGGESANFVHGVCRACYMRDHHQRRSAEAVTHCPRCDEVTANFVRGVCRACYMRDYHQRRSAEAVTDGQSSPVTDRRGSPVTDRQSSRPVTDRQIAPAPVAQWVCETPALAGGSAGARICVECREPGIYARGLCLSCYARGRRRRTATSIDGSAGRRLCVECAGPGIYARNLCQNCYMRDRRRHRRMKLRACALCGVSFESPRRDALYCSPGCRQKAHRTGKTQAAYTLTH
jgi:hypothetical protein